MHIVCKHHTNTFMPWVIAVVQAEIYIPRKSRNSSFDSLIVTNLLYKILLLFSWEFKENEKNMHVLFGIWTAKKTTEQLWIPW